MHCFLRGSVLTYSIVDRCLPLCYDTLQLMLTPPQITQEKFTHYANSFLTTFDLTSLQIPAVPKLPAPQASQRSAPWSGHTSQMWCPTRPAPTPTRLKKSADWKLCASLGQKNWVWSTRVSRSWLWAWKPPWCWSSTSHRKWVFSHLRQSMIKWHDFRISFSEGFVRQIRTVYY